MSILVKLSTTLRGYVPDYNPAQGLTLPAAAPLSAAALAEELGLPLGEIKVVMLNGRQVTLEAVVNDGDRIGYFPAVGGG